MYVGFVVSSIRAMSARRRRATDRLGAGWHLAPELSKLTMQMLACPLLKFLPSHCSPKAFCNKLTSSGCLQLFLVKL